MYNTIPEYMLKAAGEYLWLLSNGYPQKASLKLVGDKFMLSRDMRQILYRGISARKEADRRKKMIGSFHVGERVLIDSYNVLFTVNNYLLGRPVFISNDGLLRDAGEMRGRIISKPVFRRSVELMLEVLKENNGSEFLLYLDEPVSFSGRLAMELSGKMSQLDIRGEAMTVSSPDHMLRNEQSDAICTSDTAIIDHYSGKVVDLPRYLLDKYFQPDLFSLML